MQWSPRSSETAALAVLGAGLALAVLFLDAAGQVLVGAGALLLLGLAGRDLLLRPRLAAGPDGVEVRNLTAVTHLPWARLAVRVRRTRRLGVATVTLELDTAGDAADDGVLVVLGRRDLGTDPASVARSLHELDPTAG